MTYAFSEHDNDLLGFGKFSSKTYKEVYENEKKYSNWVCDQKDTKSRSMKLFQKYIQARKLNSDKNKTHNEHLANEEFKRKAHENGICPITGNKYTLIDKGWCNDRPFMSVDHVENHCSECDCYLSGWTSGGYTSKVGFWWK